MKKSFLVASLLLVVGMFVSPVMSATADEASEARRTKQIKNTYLKRYAIEIGAFDINETEYPQGQWEWKRSDLALSKAVEDVAANMTFLMLLKSHFGEVSHLDWAIPIAEKLPSQPVAVIQLMTQMHAVDTRTDLVTKMCPRMVIEDTMSDHDYVELITRSIRSLETFRMVDAKEEATRARCLKRLKEELKREKGRK